MTESREVVDGRRTHDGGAGVQPRPRKKPYVKPRLTVHGKLTDITKNNMPGSPDDGLVGRCS